MKWLKACLSDVAEINPRKRDWSNLSLETEVTFVPMSAVSEITASIECPEIRRLADVRKGYTHFRDGDVLFAKITPCMENGKMSLATDLRNGFGFGSTEFHVLRSGSQLIPPFLYYFVRQPAFRNAAKQRMQGAVGQQRVPEDFLIDYPINIPPLSEQRRIVEILDQADALRKKRAEADAKAERILPALFIRMFGDPRVWLSKNTLPLKVLVDLQGGSTPSKRIPDYWKGGVPWVSPKDMKQDILFDSTDHISRLAVEKTNLRYIAPGSVLIVVRGMILAHTVPIALAGSQLTINQDMKALQLKSDAIDSSYLYAALKASAPRLLSKVRIAAHGTRKLETNELLELPILVPSQRKLDSFRQLMTASNELSSRIDSTDGMISRLFDNLLHRAFSGELTARWREAHMKELLAEMEEQARALESDHPRQGDLFERAGVKKG